MIGILFVLFRFFPVSLVAILCAGCATKSIASFQNGRPIFNPERYFAGHTDSWGIFENRAGQPTGVLRTETQGQGDGAGPHY